MRTEILAQKAEMQNMQALLSEQVRTLKIWYSWAWGPFD